MLHVINTTTGVVRLVDKEAWVQAIDLVKKQCFDAACLIVEFEKCFLTKKLLSAIGVIYPQYWLALEVETIFQGHYSNTFQPFKGLGYFQSICGTKLLNHILFYQQPPFLNLTTQNHCRATTMSPHDSNPTTKMWEKLRSSVICNHHPSKWLKLVNICVVMVFGNGSRLVDYCLNILSDDDFKKTPYVRIYFHLIFFAL